MTPPVGVVTATEGLDAHGTDQVGHNRGLGHHRRAELEAHLSVFGKSSYTMLA